MLRVELNIRNHQKNLKKTIKRTIRSLKRKIPIANKVEFIIATPVTQQSDDIRIPMPH
tara:strand:+ start:421 stop:594 length:174 start_codon:yes stop_codon:yes gene_type:complete